MILPSNGALSFPVHLTNTHPRSLPCLQHSVTFFVKFLQDTEIRRFISFKLKSILFVMQGRYNKTQFISYWSYKIIKCIQAFQNLINVTDKYRKVICGATYLFFCILFRPLVFLFEMF